MPLNVNKIGALSCIFFETDTPLFFDLIYGC